MRQHIPLGYQIVNGKAEIAAENSQIVKAVFEEYLNGISTYQIAKSLSKQGVLNANNKPSWNHGSIGKILENSKYTGDDFYPPLIDQAKFEQVQQKRQEKAENLGRKCKPNSSILFSDKIYCGLCGEPYHRYAEHSGQVGEIIKWKCKHHIWKRRVCCRNIFLTNEQINKAFIEMINLVINNPNLLEKYPPHKPEISSPIIERLTGEMEQALLTKEYTAVEIIQIAYKRAAEQYRIAKTDDWQYQTDKLKAALRGKTIQTAFHEDLFIATTKKIVVHKDGKLHFTLRNGLLLEINIHEK